MYEKNDIWSIYQYLSETGLEQSKGRRVEMIAIERERGRQSSHGCSFPLFWCCRAFIPSLCMWTLFSGCWKLFFFLSYSGFHVFWKNWKRGPKSRSMAVVSWDSSSDLRTSFWWILSKRTHMPFLLYWKNCVNEPIMPVSPVVQLCFRIIVNFLCFCHVFVFIHPSSVHCELVRK